MPATLNKFIRGHGPLLQGLIVGAGHAREFFVGAVFIVGVALATIIATEVAPTMNSHKISRLESRSYNITACR